MFVQTLGLWSLWMACGGENVIEKVQNAAPSILILSHSDGAEIREGFVETFRASVSDDDNEFDELMVAWYIGDQIVCDWETVSATGDSTCEMVFLPEDTNVIAAVEDMQGTAGRSEVAITVLPTEAPLIDMFSPTATGGYYSNALVHFSAMISDAEDDLEDLVISWTSSVDGELPLDVSLDANGEMSDYMYLTEGNHVIELRVEDTTGKVSVEDVAIRVQGENTPPECAFIEPLDRSAYLAGEAIYFSGTATDIDIPNNTLSVEVLSNLDGVVQTLAPFSDGSFSFAVETLRVGTHTMTLRVRDEVNAECSTGMVVIVGTPPTVSIEDPTDGALYALGDAITFRGIVSDSEDQAGDLSIRWDSDIDGELGVGSPSSQGVAQLTRSDLSAGVHAITFSGTDTAGLMSDDLISVRVNQLPTVDSISFSPDPVFSNNNLAMSFTTSDLDGQNVSTTYQWYEDGVLTSFTGTSVGSAELQVGEVWTVRVTPYDGFHYGNYLESSITISNTPPIVSNVVISPSGGVYNDSVLTCTASASDIDQAISPTFQWTVNGTIYQGDTLDLATTPAMPNYVIACNGIATDDQGASDMGTDSVVLGNRDPVLGTVVITAASNGMLGDTLTCDSQVTDPDGESLTATYIWNVNGFSVGAGSVFTLNQGMVQPSDTITCIASVTDSYGATDTAAGTFIVFNDPPVFNSIEITPSEPLESDIVTCSASVTDSDGTIAPSLDFLFENVTTGTILYPNYTSSTTATLNLVDVSFTTGDVLGCHVTATDMGGSVVTDSTFVTIANSGPSVDSIAISPNAGVRTGDTLTCTATASDTDDGTIAPTYQWTVNGNLVSSTDTYTIDATDTDVGDDVICTATAIDSEGLIATDTASIEVENTPPIVSAATITPSTGVYNDSVLTCGVSIVDPDETVNPTMQWTRNGSAFAVGTTVDLGNFNVLPNQTIGCNISATDNSGANDYTSVSVIVDNRLPSLTAPIIDNPTPEDSDTITCSATTSDDDGEIPVLTYAWTNGASTLGTNPSVTLSSSTVAVGDVITCTVTSTDNFGGVVSDTATATVIDSNGATNCGLTACDLNIDLGNGQSVDFVLVSNGTFNMGSPTSEEGRGSDELQHQVTLGSDFYVMTTEVTQGMFGQLMGYDAHVLGATSNGVGSYGVGADYPTYNVSWHMAADFANALTTRHNSLNGLNLQQCYACTGSNSSISCTEQVNPYQCTGYRLLTEAEWEYAARAGTSAAIWTSNGGGDLPNGYVDTTNILTDGYDLTLYAWYKPTQSTPHGSKEVATLDANGFGIYDMSGNINEWVHDWYATYPSGFTVDPVNPSGSPFKVYRGGYWNSTARYIRSAERLNVSPGSQYSNIGFRVGRSL